jgi:hypothetical protein
MTAMWHSFDSPRGPRGDDIRSILSLITQSKSATPSKTKSPGDFPSALEDAMESLACSAICSVWYAFESCIMDWWGMELEEMTTDEFNSMADQLSTALKDTWSKFGAGTENDQMTQLAADHRLMKALVHGKLTVSKAGAAISAANRTLLEDAASQIAQVLGAQAAAAASEAEDTDDPENKAATGGAPATTPPSPAPESLDAAKGTTGADLLRERKQEVSWTRMRRSLNWSENWPTIRNG